MSENGGNRVKNIGHYFEKVLELAPTDRELYDIYERELPLLVESIDKYIDEIGLAAPELLDFGGGNGGVTEYIRKNSRYADKLKITCVDGNRTLLDDNTSADRKITSELTAFSPERTWDIVIMRFVLEFNSARDQLKIIKNVYNVLKDGGVFLNWRITIDNEEHKRRMMKLLATPDINPKLYRADSYWDTEEEMIGIKREAGFKTVVKHSYRSVIKNVFRVKYELTDEEVKEMADFLGEYDYLTFALTLSKKDT